MQKTRPDPVFLIYSKIKLADPLILHQHDSIESVIIYGSRAKGNYQVGSDIDLTIKGSILPFSELMQVEDQIDDLWLTP